MSEMDVDHLAYVTDRHYRRRIQDTLERVSRLLGRTTLKVLHEGDGICCQLEPWQVTSERISLALAHDGEAITWVFEETWP